MSVPITRATFFETASSCLNRMACVYADPGGSRHPHNHFAECLTDPQARSADLLMRLAAAIATGDEDAMLDRLGHITENLQGVL